MTNDTTNAMKSNCKDKLNAFLWISNLCLGRIQWYVIQGQISITSKQGKTNVRNETSRRVPDIIQSRSRLQDVTHAVSGFYVDSFIWIYSGFCDREARYVSVNDTDQWYNNYGFYHILVYDE